MEYHYCWLKQDLQEQQQQQQEEKCNGIALDACGSDKQKKNHVKNVRVRKDILSSGSGK